MFGLSLVTKTITEAKPKLKDKHRTRNHESIEGLADRLNLNLVRLDHGLRGTVFKVKL